MNNNENLKHTANVGEAIGAVVFTSLFYMLLNRFYGAFPFFSDDFVKILPLINTMFIISIITNACRIVLTDKWFKSIVNIVNNLIFIYVALRFWALFPLDLSMFGNVAFFELIANIVLFFMIAGTIIGTIIESIKILFRR